MTSPTDRPESGATSEATLLAVRADRARVDAARRRAGRHRRSPALVLDKIRRWVRDRRSGPIGRLRTAVGIIRTTASAGGPWRGLGPAVLRALVRPSRPGDAGLARGPVRDLDAERAERRSASMRRLDAAAARLVGVDPTTIRIAVIADADEEAALASTGPASLLRPEDWDPTLSSDGPILLVVTSARRGGHGAWAHRVAWHAHPDRIRGGDLAALIATCRDRGIPSVFVLTAAEASLADDWVDAADRFDLVLAPDAASAADLVGRLAGPATVRVGSVDRTGLLGAVVGR